MTHISNEKRALGQRHAEKLVVFDATYTRGALGESFQFQLVHVEGILK